MPVFDTGVVGSQAYDPALYNADRFSQLAIPISQGVSSLDLYNRGLIGYNDDPITKLAEALGLRTPPANPYQLAWEFQNQNPVDKSRERFPGDLALDRIAPPTIIQLSNPALYKLEGFQGSPHGSVFDSVINYITNFTNIFSGSTSVFQIVSGQDTVLPQLSNPDPVNTTKFGIDLGINVVEAVGIGSGLNTAQQAFGNFTEAAAPLPSGTYGPVTPGFFETLASGNFSGAYQLIVNPVTAAASASVLPFGATSGFVLITHQLVNYFVALTGNIGKGILDLLTQNFYGAGQDFGLIKPPSQPGPISLGNDFFRSSGGGGGGSGLGIATDGRNTGQTNSNVIPFLIIGSAALIGFIFWYKRRS